MRMLRRPRWANESVNAGSTYALRRALSVSGCGDVYSVAGSPSSRTRMWWLRLSRGPNA